MTSRKEVFVDEYELVNLMTGVRLLNYHLNHVWGLDGALFPRELKVVVPIKS